MTGDGLIDLDELVLRCRGEQARAYIREAVGCYKAGAHRSAIVSAWVAVVFDILAKLRELDLAGDKNAHAKLDDFEKIRAGGEARFKEALEFERQILEMIAKDFELLTPLEKEDLNRLRDDRNRCAHPSMQSAEEPYSPSAELARSHIRHAVEILLQREPVQGAAAFERICAEIKSSYFPTDAKDAAAHFANGPLKRARPVLIRRLVVGLTKSYLNDGDLPADERRRVMAAVQAVVEMHRPVSEQVIREQVPGVMAGVADGRLWTLIAYFRRLPAAWDLSNDAVRGKTRTYLRNVEGKEKLLAMGNAVHVRPLKDDAVGRLGDLPSKDLAALIESAKLPEYVAPALRCFQDAKSFRQAESLGESLVVPLAPVLSPETLRQVLAVVRENDQIWDAADLPRIIADLFEKTDKLRGETKTDWQDLMAFLQEHGPRDGLARGYEDLLDKMTAAGLWPR